MGKSLNTGDDVPVIELNAESSVEAVCEWMQANRNDLLASASAQGSVLIRSTPIATPNDFHAVCQSLRPNLMPYVGGNSPRTKLGDSVYTATDIGPEHAISLHNELCYSHQWPEYLFFACTKPATTGGETLVGSGKTILEGLHPDLLVKFEELGVTYVQNLHGGHGLGRSWMEMFETSDRSLVEAYLTGGGAEFEWGVAGRLTVRQTRPATRYHPVAGHVWFNQAEQWHSSYLGKAFGQRLQRLMRPEDLPRDAFFGDGTAFTSEELAAIRRSLGVAERQVQWQRGDFLVIDNVASTHGRSTYTGTRSVLVAMG